MEISQFLPVTKEEMKERDWYWYDYLIVTGDAYVDHPSFGPAVIGRVLEKAGFRVAVLAQPEWKTADAFLAMGKPRMGVMISSGNIDSMVAHYTAAKKHRNEDFYSPGKKAGLRPDRAVIVYANRAREAFGKDVPILIGGLEASLHRFAHYDYWDNKVRRSILFDAAADMLIFGMGERTVREVAQRQKAGIPVSAMHDIPGTAFAVSDPAPFLGKGLMCAAFEMVAANKKAYAEATRLQYEEHDPVRGRTIVQPHGDHYLVVLPPAMPLTTQELDEAATLPYTREYHPMYEEAGGVPALDEVRFSIIHNRGCFGACNFCSLAWHQGRMVTSRSQDSVLKEARDLTQNKHFKGYINDVGGPTANFRHFSCKDQDKRGMCRNRKCLTPEPCNRLDADHSDYLALLRRLRKVPGVKKVFIRSGIRYDYLLEDKNRDFLEELITYHISGQLKIAPEHCVSSVLDYMGKPHIDVYQRFMALYSEMNEKQGKDQFVVPYLMSSHPGSTLSDAVALAEFLRDIGRQPEQVQDFYPTPGTISTCMYFTGLDPMTMERVYVAKTPHEKDLQRALLQWRNPENRALVVEALRKAERPDLIGHDPKCLIRPETRAQKEASAAAGKSYPRKEASAAAGKGYPSKEASSASGKGYPRKDASSAAGKGNPRTGRTAAGKPEDKRRGAAAGQKTTDRKPSGRGPADKKSFDRKPVRADINKSGKRTGEKKSGKPRG